MARKSVSPRDLEALSLSDLRVLEAELPTVIAAKENAERKAFLEEMAEEAQARGLDLAAVVNGGRSFRSKAKVAPKYRHPKHRTLTWTGRGRTPLWVLEYESRGKSRESLLIK